MFANLVYSGRVVVQSDNATERACKIMTAPPVASDRGPEDEIGRQPLLQLRAAGYDSCEPNAVSAALACPERTGPEATALG